MSSPLEMSESAASRRRSALTSVGAAVLGLALGGGLALLVGAVDVLTGIAAGLALATLLLMVVFPEIPVHVVLFVVYTNVSVVAADQGALQGVIAGGVLALLAIPLAHHLVLHRRALRSGPVFAMMVVLLGIFALSAARALDSSTAIERIVSYAVEGLAVFLLIVNVVRSVPAVRRAMATLLLAGSVLGGLTLYQGLTGSFTEDFGGLAQSSFAFAVDDPTIEGTSPADGAVATGVVNRAGGPLNEPNRFAQVLIVLLPLALYQIRFGRSGASRAFGLGAGFLILGGMLLTYSRGAFLTLAILVALCAIVGFVRPSRIVLAAVVLLAVAPVMAPGIYDRIGSISGALDILDPADRSGADGVARGRTTETLAAVHAFLDHPVLGVGPGHYLPHYSVRYQLDPNTAMRYLPEPRRAHSLYAEMAAESGALGLLTFLTIPLLLLSMLWRRRRALAFHRPDLANLATAFWLAILGYLGTGVFLHLAFERYYWLLLALSAATCYALGEHVERMDEELDTDAGYDGLGWERIGDEDYAGFPAFTDRLAASPAGLEGAPELSYGRGRRVGSDDGSAHRWEARA